MKDNTSARITERECKIMNALNQAIVFFTNQYPQKQTLSENETFMLKMMIKEIRDGLDIVNTTEGRQRGGDMDGATLYNTRKFLAEAYRGLKAKLEN